MATDLVPTFPIQTIGNLVTQNHIDSSNDILRATITSASHNFLRASPSLHEAAILIAKRYLDPLATSISNEQAARLQAARRKRKRGEESVNLDVLKLKELYVQDFTTDQIWEQSKRILDAAAKEVQITTDNLLDEDDAPGPQKNVHFEEEEDVSDLEDSEASLEDELEEDGENELSEGEEDFEDEIEEQDFEDGSDIEQDEDDSLLDDEDEKAGTVPKSVFVKDKHGLNDGFFSIDDFNRATEFLEQVDARGDPDDGAASDEEDVDWAANPMDQPLADGLLTTKSEKKSKIDDEDGPTFGDADLNAPWSDDDDAEEADEDIEMDDAAENNANEIYYKDFFAPPARSLTKTKRARALPKTQPTGLEEEDIQRTISAVHRDIFSDDDIDGSEASGDEKNQNLSTHEKRQKALAEQIRKLEAEAVAKRQWTLTGEARAADRPVNSLLEDDLVLDFERTGKPVPESTAALTETIEDLIKARILARNFDEIHKRRGGLEVGGDAQGKRGLVELDDRKNQQSLAEIYETEHLKANDPNYVDPRDTETKKAHQEIEALWKSVSAKLDALSSWHYKPKPADMEVRVVTDAPRVQMEDARPAGVGIGMEESGLAPQEVYRVGEELNGKKGDANVVVTPGGALVARHELTREQKTRRRRREKERIKKKGSDKKVAAPSTDGTTTAVPAAKRSKKSEEKKNILEELRRGNVKVVGKGGAVQDIEGRTAQLGASTERSAGGLKL